MQGFLRAGCAALVIATAVLIAGCEQARQPAASDLALVTQALDEQLNASAAQLRASLKRAYADKRIYPEELDITGPAGTAPADWWVYRKGLIKLGGVDSYRRGYFVLTPKGEAFVAGPDPRWLVSTFQSPPQVVCGGGGGFSSCRITGTATVKLSAAGAALFDAVSVAPQPLTAMLAYGASGWSASDVQVTGRTDPSTAGETALFGDRDAMFKAHYRWGEEVNRLVR